MYLVQADLTLDIRANVYQIVLLWHSGLGLLSSYFETSCASIGKKSGLRMISKTYDMLTFNCHS